MPRTNEQVAALLQEYADLLLITGSDAVRARAYQKAARSVAGHSDDVSRMSPAELRRIPGVGKSIADKISEAGTAGTIRALEELRGLIPPGVRELTRIPGSGPPAPSSSTPNCR